MRYVKAALVLLTCIVLLGLILQQTPKSYEVTVTVLGVALGFALARRQLHVL